MIVGSNHKLDFMKFSLIHLKLIPKQVMPVQARRQLVLDDLI